MRAFTGTGIALITPFDENAEVDFQSLSSLLDFTTEGGVDFLVAMGTTAESATLSLKEKDAVVAHIIQHNQSKLPMVLGMGGNNTADLVSQIKSQDMNGIDAILSVSPYYNRPSQEGIYQHFIAVADASPVPVILYNVPSRTGSNMQVDTVCRLAEHANIIAIKEAAGSINQAMELLMALPEDFIVLSGDDNLTVPMMHMGAKGVISVSAQAYPAHFKDIMRADVKLMNDRHYDIYHFTNLLFKEGNPAGLKSALKTMGVIESDQVRLPLIKATKGLEEELAEEIAIIAARA